MGLQVIYNGSIPLSPTCKTSLFVDVLLFILCEVLNFTQPLGITGVMMVQFHRIPPYAICLAFFYLSYCSTIVHYLRVNGSLPFTQPEVLSVQNGATPFNLTTFHLLSYTVWHLIQCHTSVGLKVTQSGSIPLSPKKHISYLFSIVGKHELSVSISCCV